MCSRFHLLRESARGFSLIELMIVVGFAIVMMAISVPILTDISRTTKLNDAVRSVERELQSARLRAVNLNRPLRVRLNGPGNGSSQTTGPISDHPRSLPKRWHRFRRGATLFRSTETKSSVSFVRYFDPLPTTP